MDIKIEPDNKPEKVKAGINKMARIMFDSEETNSLDNFRKALFNALKEVNNEFGPPKASIAADNN